jgi:hypothetical protein
MRVLNHMMLSLCRFPSDTITFSAVQKAINEDLPTATKVDQID